MVSGLAIPAIAAHLKQLEMGTLFMGLAGGLVVYASVLVLIITFILFNYFKIYIHCFHPREDEYVTF